jgi:hypothetical protein
MKEKAASFPFYHEKHDLVWKREMALPIGEQISVGQAGRPGGRLWGSGSGQ